MSKPALPLVIGVDPASKPDRMAIFVFTPRGSVVRWDSPPCAAFTPPWSAVAAKPIEPTDITFTDKKQASE